VGRYIYDNNSLDRLKFTGYALSKKLKVLKKYRTAYFWISADDLKKYNSKTGDTEGLGKLCPFAKGSSFFGGDYSKTRDHPNFSFDPKAISLSMILPKIILKEVVIQMQLVANQTFRWKIR
jgi:hypothetical protein